MSEPKIAYVKHPVSDEVKKAAMADHDRIIDARFAPEGAEIFGDESEKPKKEAKSKKNGKK